MFRSWPCTWPPSSARWCRACRVGWAAQRGPVSHVDAGLFCAASLRTRRAPFSAPGSPAIYAVCATGFAWTQSFPAALAENVKYHFGCLHCASLMVPSSFIACAPSPCGPSLAVSRLDGRYPADYYRHSVAIGLVSLRRSHVHNCCTCRARLRRPVRLLECPDRASLLRPGGVQRASRQPAAGAGTGFRRLSGRRRIAPSGD
jgi:hypothetical protein